MLYYLIPIAMLIDVSLIAMLASGLVTMHQHQSLGLILALSCLLFACLIVAIALFPFAVNITEYSKLAPEFWNRQRHLMPREYRKDLLAWQKIQLKAGPFFSVEKSTPTSFLFETIDKTISLLLFFRSY
jgi:hypothetical protein